MPPQNTSLRRLLSLDQPPTSPRTPIQSKRAPIERLPAFILHDIGRHSDLRDVLHLSLCSHRLSRVLAPVLYASVELTTNRNCKNALIALAKRPDLMQHVRRLVVRPNCVEWTDEGEEMDEGLVATLISRMAVSLRALEVFEWDGMEMAGSVLWAALKLSCRNLKRIGTSIGEDPLDPSSPLWEFEDLRQFSLRVKCHSLDWISGGLAKPEKLPRRFWEMILERSPRLEDLTISSPAPSPRTFDIRHITCGRWSRLHALTLGDHVLISSDQNNYNTKDHKALMAFFLHHPGLRTLRLEHTPGSAYFPAGFDFETSHALPNVEEFAGPIAWVRTLPVQQRLRRLRVVGMHHSYHGYGIADSNVARTCRVLAGLRWLEELSVWIDLSVGGGAATASGVGANGRRASFSGRKETSASEDVNMEVVNKFLVSRPGLKHLEVSCFSRPTFSIKDFSATIRRSAPTLESFTLTKVHKSGDDEERELTRLAAANIATDNPGLRKFTLRTTVDPWYSPGFGFHVEQSAGMGGANAGGRLKQLGVYEVLESFTVVPSTLEQSNSDGRGFEGEEFGVLDRTEPSHIAMPTTTTALLVREWGQKTKSATSRLIMDTLGSKSQTSRCYVFPLNLSDPLSSSSSMPGYDSDTNTSPPSSATHTVPRLRLASLSPPTSPTNATHFPPSSWQKNTSILNKKHSHSRSLSGGGTSGSSPFSLLTRTRSRSNSPSPCHPANVGWRPRRASCSSGESFGGGWEGYGSAHGHGSARAGGGGGGGVPSNRSRSNRSSFSSTFEAAGSASGCVTLGSSSGCGGGQAQPAVYRRVQIQTQVQPFALQDPNEQPIFDSQQAFPQGRHPPPQQGGQVTWAESVQENSSLRRSGSASTTGNSGASSSSDSQSTPPPPPPPLPEKRSRTKSLRLSGLRWGIGKGRGKWKEEIIQREVVIEEGYILV